jgi:hypothetical protein
MILSIHVLFQPVFAPFLKFNYLGTIEPRYTLFRVTNIRKDIQSNKDINKFLVDLIIIEWFLLFLNNHKQRPVFHIFIRNITKMTIKVTLRWRTAIKILLLNFWFLPIEVQMDFRSCWHTSKFFHLKFLIYTVM